MNNIDKLQKSINQLEEIVSNLVEERNALQAENKKLKEQQLTEDELSDTIRLRYFKLMQPDVTESDAEIVAGSLAKAISTRLKGKE